MLNIHVLIIPCAENSGSRVYVVSRLPCLSKLQIRYMTTREIFTRMPKSNLSTMFDGRWEYKLSLDQNKSIFSDINIILLRYLL